jgi:hypothetical protein
MSEYNQETCITAGDLRSVGIPVPERIPDCAWISRSAVKCVPILPEQAFERVARGEFAVEFKITFLEHFRWVTVQCSVVPEPICGTAIHLGDDA